MSGVETYDTPRGRERGPGARNRSHTRLHERCTETRVIADPRSAGPATPVQNEATAVPGMARVSMRFAETVKATYLETPERWMDTSSCVAPCPEDKGNASGRGNWTQMAGRWHPRNNRHYKLQQSTDVQMTLAVHR